MFGWYAAAEPYLIPAQLVMVMAGMGATLKLADFAGVVRSPGSLAVALGLHWLLVPLAAALLARGLGLSAGWTVGLLLISVAPPAAFSNLLTFIGRGNLALSVSTTALATLGSIVTVPVLLRWLGAAELPLTLVLPVRRIVLEIVLYVLAPLAAGMLARRALGGRAARIAQVLVGGGLVLVVVLTVGALGSGRIDVAAYGWGPPLRIVLFGVAMALMTPQVCRLLGRYDDDTLTLAVQVSMRNMGVALLMARFFFTGRPEQGQVFYSCLFYAGTAVWFALPGVIARRLGRSLVVGPPRPRPADG